MKKDEFYNPSAMLEKCPDAKYYFVYGEKSNGKTFAFLNIILFGYHSSKIDVNGYLDDGSQGAVIRRFYDDISGGTAKNLFENFVNNTTFGNIIEKKTGGRWNRVAMRGNEWHLAKMTEDDLKIDPTPFCYRFSLTGEQKDHSGYPRIKNILFDEVITRKYYLPDEFVTFQKVISNIVRERNDARIYMTGNAINRYCIYFKEMGLTHVRKQEQGTIDVYGYGESALKVAVEYSKPNKKSKKSDVYFAFDNPKLKMITTGEWEIGIYPHLPYPYYPTDVLYQFFIRFEEDTLHGEVISKDGEVFVYLHRKTTEIKDEGKYLVFQSEYSTKPNFSRNFLKPKTRIHERILDMFVKDRFYYQDNEIGEVMRNYVIWCKNSKMGE